MTDTLPRRSASAASKPLLLLGALLALVLALPAYAAKAAPTTFTTNASRFDFTDNSLTKGYIGFAVQGNQLEVLFGSAGAISDVPSIKLWVPHSTTDAFQAAATPSYSPSGQSATVYPTLSDLQDVTFGYYGDHKDALTVTHGSTTVEKAAFGYLSTFKKLGFTATKAETVGSTLVVYDLSDHNLNVRLVLHQNGPDVTAYLHGERATGSM